MTFPRPRFHDEDGIALVLVIGVSAVMAVLVVAALGFAQNATSFANIEQSDLSSVSAAQAGLDDYLFRLNSDDAYVLYDDTNPDSGNAAFTAWVPVPGDASEGEFTYDVDISQLGATGVISVVASGRVNGVVRSVSANIRRQSFLEFLYLTDLETLDPDAYAPLSVDPDGDGNSPFLYGNDAVAWANANCSTYRWLSERPIGSRQCREIYWANSDVVNGPFHTNDKFRISGTPTWQGTTTSSSNDGVLYTGSGTPNFNGGPPVFRSVLPLPPNNTEIRVEADYAVGSAGCLFTGPTRIVLDDNQLEVTSPFTQTSGANCGSYSIASPTDRINIPSNGVVYVQNVPSSGDNSAAGCPSVTHPFGLPYTDIGLGATDDSTYACRSGDVFLDGVLDGRLTIASENNIYIVNDTLRDDQSGTSDDMLGLVANNSVLVYHPADDATDQSLRSGPWYPSELNTNLTVEAAILSVAHSWAVPVWYAGDPMGDLNVFGAIAQQYRGPVGTFSGSTQVSGYDKNYVYDERLKFINPPHFINPVAAEWRIRQFTEVLGHTVTTTN